MNENGNDQKLDWMYKGATGLVDREEYLLGRSVDKTLEQLNTEEKEKKLGIVPPKNHVEHECIPPSIRDFNKIVQAEQVDLSAKLQEDPLVAIKKREEEARRQFLQNPVQLKKLQEALKAQKKNRKKRKAKKSDSDSDLDNKIAEKLKYLKQDPSRVNVTKKKKSKEGILDTILMHKFNQLKDKLSQEDLNDILAGKVSDSDEERKKRSRKRKNSYSCSSDDSDSRRKKTSKKKSKRRSSSSSEENYIKTRNRSSSSEDEKHVKDNYKKNKNDKNYSKNRHENSRILEKGRKRGSSSESDKGEKPKHKSRRFGNECSTESAKEKYVTKEHAGIIKESDSDLETKILNKLRLLRDSVKSKNNQNDSQEVTESSSGESDAQINKKKLYYGYSDDEREHKPRTFGLVRSDGTKIALNKKNTDCNSKIIKPTAKVETVNKPERKNVARLTDEEKERLRREMMKDAEKREKERSENLRKYREEDINEEKNHSHNFSNDFMHKELLKSTKDATVETRIKSNLNNIQRLSKHMDSHFSRRK